MRVFTWQLHQELHQGWHNWISQWIGYVLRWRNINVVAIVPRTFKARSHGAIFSECDCDFFIACNGLCGCQWYCSHDATAMHFCAWHRIQMGFTPILCDCDVRFQWMQCAFQCKYIAIASTSASHHVNKITKSHATFHFLIANRTSHIAPCEGALKALTLWMQKKIE